MCAEDYQTDTEHRQTETDRQKQRQRLTQKQRQTGRQKQRQRQRQRQTEIFVSTLRHVTDQDLLIAAGSRLSALWVLWCCLLVRPANMVQKVLFRNRAWLRLKSESGNKSWIRMSKMSKVCNNKLKKQSESSSESRATFTEDDVLHTKNPAEMHYEDGHEFLWERLCNKDRPTYPFTSVQGAYWFVGAVMSQLSSQLSAKSTQMQRWVSTTTILKFGCGHFDVMENHRDALIGFADDNGAVVDEMHRVLPSLPPSLPRFTLTKVSYQRTFKGSYLLG